MSMHTPWGVADYVKFHSPERDVVQVSTSRHGGLGVKAPRTVHPALAALATNNTGSPLAAGEWLWFEEDCAWSAVALSFPELFAPDVCKDAERCLRSWYPSEYEAFTGRSLAAGESRRRDDQLFKDANRDKFLARAAYGDWAWDVPLGKVYVCGQRESDGAQTGFLVPEEQYVNTDRLVLDPFPRWAPNVALPYSKGQAERQANAAAKAAGTKRSPEEAVAC